MGENSKKTKLFTSLKLFRCTDTILVFYVKTQSCKSINTNCNYVINCSVFKGVVWRRKKLTFAAVFIVKKKKWHVIKRFGFSFMLEHNNRSQQWALLLHVEGPPSSLLHVSLLLQCPEPSGGPEWREAHGGGERALRVQVHNSATTVRTGFKSWLTVDLLPCIYFPSCEQVIEFCKAFLCYPALTILFVKQSSLPEILIGVWKDVQAGLKGLV